MAATTEDIENRYAKNDTGQRAGANNADEKEELAACCWKAQEFGNRVVPSALKELARNSKRILVLGPGERF